MAEAHGCGAGAEPPALPGLPKLPQLSVRFLEQLVPRVPEGFEAGAAQTRGFTTKPGSASGGLSVDPNSSAQAQSLEASTGRVSLFLLNLLYLNSLVPFSPSAHPGGSLWDSASTTHSPAGMGIPLPARPAPQNGAAWSEGDWGHGAG